MLKFRFILVALVVLVLVAMPLVGASAQAPYYYCARSVTAGGAGTYYAPWACSTAAQETNARNLVCTYGGGTLYVIETGRYYPVFVSRPAAGTCQYTVGAPVNGWPPNTGVDLPAPVLYGGIAAAGALLLAAGLFIRRKRTA